MFYCENCYLLNEENTCAFCLYNGGFTAGFTCFLFIPVLEHFCKTKQQRKELRAGK